MCFFVALGASCRKILFASFSENPPINVFVWKSFPLTCFFVKMSKHGYFTPVLEHVSIGWGANSQFSHINVRESGKSACSIGISKNEYIGS